MSLKKLTFFSHKKLIRFLTSEVRVRFAPSPTGQLHLGGLRTALYNYLFATKHNGKLILRIEDTDQTRTVPNAVEKLIDILDWVGIHFHEGPMQDGLYGPYIQSERLELYMKYKDKLLKNGRAYKCFCTEQRLNLLRKNAMSRGEIPRYDNRCRHLNNAEIIKMEEKGNNYVVRLKLEHMIDSWQDLVYGNIKYDVASNEGDPIIMKSDGFPTYHFANVIDDYYMHITHVLRGLEWQVSTSKHILLYKALDWTPPYFAHLPLLTNKDGKKFSKRQDDIRVEHYRKEGYFPESVVSLLLQTGSGFDVQDNDHLSLNELANHFDISLLNTNSSRVNFDNLPELNKLHLKRKICDPSEIKTLVSKLKDLLQKKYSNIDFNELQDDYLSSLLFSVKDRIHFAEDLLLSEYEFIFVNPNYNREDLPSIIDTDGIKKLSDKLVDVQFSANNLSNLLHDFGGSGTVKVDYQNLMQTLRQLLGGAKKGPSVVEMMLMLGKERTLLRLQQYKEYLLKQAIKN